MGIFRNQFFHNDIEHCAGGESQHERHDAQHGRGKQEYQCPADRLDDSAERADAATITPEAKPSRTFCTIGGISRFMKNTKAEPRAVPRNGIKSAVNTGSISFVYLYLSTIDFYFISIRTGPSRPETGSGSSGE